MPIVRLDTAQQFLAINVLSDPGAIGGPYIVPQCARISLFFNQESGKAGKIILVGRYAGGFAGTPAQAQSILTALNTGAQWTALAAFLPTSTALNNVGIQNVAIAGQPVITATTGGGGAGTSASPSLPNEVAAVITKRTALVGKANRGRMYFPGWATNALGAGNVIAAAAVTALQNWANTVNAALSAQGYTHVIGQPARNAYTGSTGTPHPARAATSVDVTALQVRDNHWDSQRRRGLK